MSSLSEKSQVVGIVVHSIPFQDLHQIITLYSPEWGLMKILIKYAYRTKSSQSVEPLNLVEICLKTSKSDLFQALSVTRLNTYLLLRSSYEVLHSSLELLAAIARSQVYHKPSPILFSLLLRYLEYMPQAKSPKSLKASFKLKVLRHDGWLAIVDNCNSCQSILNEVQIAEGQFFCSAHAPSYALSFSPSETLYLKELALGLSFSRIDSEIFSSKLEEKINSLFAGFISN